MNIITRAMRVLSGRKPAIATDVQAAPVSWSPDMGASTVTLKIDHAVRLGQAVLVAGWSTGHGDVRLCANGKPLDTGRFKTARPDVARYLGRDEADGLGLVLLAYDRTCTEAIEVECLARDGQTVAKYPITVKHDEMTDDARIMLEPALDNLKQALSSDPKAMRQLDTLLNSDSGSNSFASGALDDVRSSAETRQAVASGWLLRRPGVEAWLEDGQGRVFPLDQAHRAHRDDVTESMAAEVGAFAAQSGFLWPLQDIAPGDRIRLMARLDDEVVALAEAGCKSWGSDPLSVSRWLFGFPTAITQFAKRVGEIDLSIIEPLIRARQSQWPQLPVRVEEVGNPLQAPKASLIIPLYGRFDFVEHQLLEFARDPWLLANAEVVYVIDDVDLVDRMAGAAWSLARLYAVPFRWLWGGVNRGFSGANNLGAAHARGQYFVFLNSDAIPRQPGWLKPLLEALDNDPGLGAVGPRLLFGDGSIQHAGMEFRRREDLGIWTNHHPCMGLDPALDPHRSLTEVACVTGACLAMRRSDFDRVQGWDTGYLVGDFEDSDLCMKLRAAGLRIGYLPQVELTHLERQSFKALGTGDYRMQVVVYNAVRHQQRWAEALMAASENQQECAQ